MGGHALKIETVRKSTIEFNKIFNEIEPKLKELNLEYFLTKCYRNKDSHGDMDILIKNNIINTFEIVETIKKTFKPESINKNDKSISFNYDDFQIDFILINPDRYDFICKWYSYDPFANCCGKLAHKFGLKFATDGLYYVHRNAHGNIIETIFISDDFEKSLTFLGYDYKLFEKGFDDLEDIFNFVISSKYFDNSIFLYENLNNRDRNRNRKRKTFNQFLKYINDNINKKYNFDKKENYIKIIDEYFNCGLVEKIRMNDEKDLLINKIKNKFNGRLVLENFPELSKGENFGRMLSSFKDSHLNYNEYILNTDQNQILNDFKTFISE